MAAKNTTSGPRLVTAAGLLAGAAGIAVLWASGVVFPFYPPPGLLILLVGFLFVLLVRWRWAPVAGVALGLFVIVGFLLSSTGVDNLTGDAGLGASLGSAIQLLGVTVALVAGVVAVLPRTAGVAG